ncbi:hypothetical protein TNCV_210241 [Trichonephila clavipes]|uniref:Uncharacterized protein n=1 Tax=Trichonephila clavipes TaxID=2585209 RepID=A0A8X6VIW1_TRICX|nr:hypothetical protein TNCV_210241 [Trichonephila clavipes]
MFALPPLKRVKTEGGLYRRCSLAIPENTFIALDSCVDPAAYDCAFKQMILLALKSTTINSSSNTNQLTGIFDPAPQLPRRRSTLPISVHMTLGPEVHEQMFRSAWCCGLGLKMRGVVSKGKDQWGDKISDSGVRLLIGCPGESRSLTISLDSDELRRDSNPELLSLLCCADALR